MEEYGNVSVGLNVTPVIMIIFIFLVILTINFSIAKNLYRYSLIYKNSHDHYLLFLHPNLMVIIGLVFGIFASIIVNIINSIENRRE